jgi:lipopolysaccharide transport system permease protein
MPSNVSLAFADLTSSLKKYRLIHELAWNDIKQRYRRTVLGPLWISLSIAATILGLGLLFGIIFNQKNAVYLPYIAVGILFWTFISTVISEGSDSLIAMNNVIKQISLPYSLYVFRVIYRNFIMLGHNLVIATIIFYLLDIQILHPNIEVIPQVILGILNLFWIALLLAVISTRYRDINPIVTNGLQLFFYLTPIIWMAEQVQGSTFINAILRYNPFYYILLALRSLMDGVLMTSNQLLVLGIMAIVGSILSFAIFIISYKRIAFWL